jgi:hypothetical protein
MLPYLDNSIVKDLTKNLDLYAHEVRLVFLAQKRKKYVWLVDCRGGCYEQQATEVGIDIRVVALEPVQERVI